MSFADVKIKSVNVPFDDREEVFDRRRENRCVRRYNDGCDDRARHLSAEAPDLSESRSAMMLKSQSLWFMCRIHPFLVRNAFPCKAVHVKRGKEMSSPCAASISS